MPASAAPASNFRPASGAERYRLAQVDGTAVVLPEHRNQPFRFTGDLVDGSVAELRDGTVRTFEVSPEEAGLTRARRDDLRGGDATTNADALRALLDGVRGPYRDIVALNSAAALIVSGQVDDLEAGVARALDAIDSGAAKDVLRGLIAISSEATPGE